MSSVLSPVPVAVLLAALLLPIPGAEAPRSRASVPSAAPAIPLGWQIAAQGNEALRRLKAEARYVPMPPPPPGVLAQGSAETQKGP